MAPKTDQGCATPPAAAEKQIHRRLVELFAPLVYFEPEERFFPVDLPNAVRSSALWKIDPLAKPQTAQREKDFGAIVAAQDLPAAGADHFTTVAGTDVIQKAVDGQPPFHMPAPRIDPIYHRYADGTLPAVLTMYATVCRARDVPNSSLLSKCSDKDVQHGMGEGLIINYYFYFPACEAPEFKSEGDWSGISLLLREAPTQLAQLASAEQLKPFLPVIACYYRKATKFAPPLPSFVAGDHGFRRWQDVRRTAEAGVGADTHPVVYISRGRHNCTYEPATTNIASSPPWEATFTADRIEGGDYAPGPAETTLQGGGIEEFPGWGYALFPPLAVIAACATGCDYPMHFDTSGLPSAYEEVEDRTADGGYGGLPGPHGSPYPKQSAAAVPPAAKQIGLKLEYVDLDDAQTAALWGYAGAWGGATVRSYAPTWAPDAPSHWGYYRGAQRPSLAAWFVWNLFLDRVYGCHGIPDLTRSPW